MKRLFSVVIVLFFLAAIGFAGTTIWFGMQTEKQYHHILGQASEYGYIQLTNESYDRGFFKSRARTTVRIPDFSSSPGTGSSKGRQEHLGVTLVHEIRHGPLPLGEAADGETQLKPVMAIIETRVELSPETQAKLKEAFAELPEIVSMKNHTTLSLGGNGETRLVIPSFDQTVGKEKKIALNWKGLTANMVFTSDLKQFTGSLSAPGLEAVGDEGKLVFNGLASTFETHESISGIFLGNASFDLARLKFSGKESGKGKHFSMDALKMTTSSRALTDTVTYAMTMQIDRAMTDDTVYGPGVCEIELRKLDAATLAQLQRVSQQLQAEFAQRSVEDINKIMLAKYTELLPGLMKKSPELEITRLSLKTADGDFSGRAKIIVDGTNAAAVSNPLLLLGAVTAHADLTVTDRLLQRINESSHEKKIMAAIQQGRQEPLSDNQIKMLAATKSQKRLEALVTKNILIYEDGNYKLSADYQRGQVTLNGSPLTLQDLLQQG